jgi:urease accessory protein UreE
MWCDRILGNVVSWNPQDTARLDWVDLTWQQCGRIVQKESRGERKVRVLLPPGQRARHGDLLLDDGVIAIAINVVPCEVVVVQSTDPILTFELGNLHCPTEITEARIIFVEDGPAMEALEKLGHRWSREIRRFQPRPTVATPSVTLSPVFSVRIKPAP